MGHHRDTADGVQSTRRRLRRLHGDNADINHQFNLYHYQYFSDNDPTHDIDYSTFCPNGTCDHPGAIHDSTGRCYHTTPFGPGGSSADLYTSCPCGR